MIAYIIYWQSLIIDKNIKIPISLIKNANTKFTIKLYKFKRYFA